MTSKIIDTNVPLTAAGLNSNASKKCQLRCVAVLKAIFSGELKVVIDSERETLREYNRRIHPNYRGSLAEQFMLHMLQYQTVTSSVHCVELARDSAGNYIDYPDNGDIWTSDVRRCERFDPDDKKWVALAVRFKNDTGTDAPIVNAADRCWLAFESHLDSAGVKLEYLCSDER